MPGSSPTEPPQLSGPLRCLLQGGQGALQPSEGGALDVSSAMGSPSRHLRPPPSPRIGWQAPGHSQGQRGTRPTAPLTAVQLVAVVGAVGPAVAAQLVPDAAASVAHELPGARCGERTGLRSGPPRSSAAAPLLPTALPGANRTATLRADGNGQPGPERRGAGWRGHRGQGLQVHQAWQGVSFYLLKYILLVFYREGEEEGARNTDQLPPDPSVRRLIG